MKNETHEPIDVSTCQDDLVRLVEAWCDRGIEVPDAAQIIAGFGSVLMAKLGYDKDGLKGALDTLWNKHGKTPL